MSRKLSFETRLARKSSELAEVILAVRAAVPTVQSNYEREEELPDLLSTLVDGSETTFRGSTIWVTAEKIARILAREEMTPEIAHAVDLLHKALGLGRYLPGRR